MKGMRALALAWLLFILATGTLWAREKYTETYNEGDGEPVPSTDAGASGNSGGKTGQKARKNSGETLTGTNADQEDGAPKAEPWRAVVENLSPGYWEASPLPAEGKVMYYNPGVMERVLAFRLEAGHVTECPECVGYAAMLRGKDLDRRIWIERTGHLAEGPFWVIDVAAPQHVPMLLERGWVGDVDYETAMRWRMAGPVSARVLAQPPPDAFLGAITLPLHWNATPVPAENFHWPPAVRVYYGAVGEAISNGP